MTGPSERRGARPHRSAAPNEAYDGWRLRVSCGVARFRAGGCAIARLCCARMSGVGTRGSKWVLVCAASVVALGWCPSARAESWLTWPSRDECPTAQDIERRVQELLRGSVPAEGLHVAAQAEPVADGWDVRVDVTLKAHAGQRRVTVSSCEQAADFVAVAVVLAIDPGFESEPAAQPLAPPEPTVLPASSRVRAAPPEATPAARSTSRRVLRPFAQAAGEASWQPLPAVAWGADLALGATFDRLLLSVGTRWLPLRTVIPRQAVAPIEFSLISARVAGSYAWRWSTFSLGPVLAVDGGGVFTRERGSNASDTEQLWFALGAGAMATFDLAQVVSLYGEVEAVVPLTQPLFVLDDGTHVHDVGVGGRVAAGVRFFFSAQ